MTAERGDFLRDPVEQAPAPGPQVIFGFDADGICTMSIGPGLKLLGLEPGQLVGQNLFDVYTERSSHESLNRALAGESFTVERDLGERRLSVYYQSIVDGAGKVTGAIGVATDVTEHRRMERAEQASLRRASLLADLSSALNRDVRDLETLLKVATRSLTTAVAERGVLWLRTADGDLLEPRASWALDADDLRPVPVPVPDITAPEVLNRDGRAVLRLPLRSRGHLVGLVELSRGAAGPFTDDELSLAADMADRSGLVIDNALLFLAERRAHEELVAFKALADASTNLIAISDEENRFRYVNPSVRSQGFTVVERDIWETVTTHLAEPAAAELRRSLVSTGRWSGDLEVTVGEETRIVHLDAFELPHPETGEHLGSAWIAQDFTDLRATEAALRAAVSDIEQFKALVEASPDFIAIAALDGTVTYVNPRGRELIGMDPSVDVTTTNVTDYLPPGDEHLWQEVREAVAATGHWEGESTLRNHRGGPPIRVATSSFLIRGAEDGHPIAMATVERDITERLAAEAALREMAAQREALLTHLVDAQDAERAQIAADVHDDPVQALAAVDLRLGLLRRRLRERAPDLLEFLEPLQASVSGATDRLRALLFDLEPPDLQHGLAGALKRAAEEVFDGTPTRWRVEGEAEPAMPESTRAIAYRIAKEALVNVLKHAAAEQVEVTVTGRDGGLEVSVADDGVGLDATRSGTSAGRHRGLMTMEERAMVAGGRCTVRNRRGRGTRVTLWLPGPDRTE